jgi:hypothetical protein
MPKSCRTGLPWVADTVRQTIFGQWAVPAPFAQTYLVDFAKTSCWPRFCIICKRKL